MQLKCKERLGSCEWFHIFSYYVSGTTVYSNNGSCNLYWIISGGKNTQGETSTGLSKGSSEIAEGCGAGCLLGIAVIGFMGFVIYRIFVAIPSY